MLDGLKKKIQDSKLDKARLRFDKELAYYKDRYKGWIHEVEPGLKNAFLDGASSLEGSLSLQRMSAEGGLYPLTNYSGEILYYAKEEGTLDTDAQRLIQAAFLKNPTWDLVYFDEDYQYGEDRVAPFMKPDYSPDTLLSFPYFGHCFAIRRSSFATIEWLEGADKEERIYDFLLKCMVRIQKGEAGKAGHIPIVLYHNAITEEEYEAYRLLEVESYKITSPRELTADENLPWFERLFGRSFEAIRPNAASLLGYPATIKKDSHGLSHLLYRNEGELISILIPSKDNPDVLERLLYSIRDKSAYKNYEIIVVDNGSSGRVRTRLMNFANTAVPFLYVYEPMDFNFSHMVNLAASKAKGDYLLLLNDDTEVLEEDWLETMLGQARLPHVGAVGAKLIYPGTNLMQHTGVTNLSVGPAHKLQEKSDDYSYYYGKNRVVYDYIGVTAACLMLSKEKYWEVGGLDEEIKVAFNDVELCFKLIEKGYFNVMRPDVRLYHYESLSRGNDLLSEEKKKRMLSERDKLYDRHESFWGKDPYYSPNLMGNAIDYVITFYYDYERESFRSAFKPFTENILPEWYNDSIYPTIEINHLTETLEDRRVELVYHMSGWAYVLNQDNCRYTMRILLKKDGQYIEVDTPRHYRPDVVQILPEQTNVEMSGFLLRIDEGALPSGDYEIWIYMKDTCSRQRLLKNTGEILKVK